MVPSRKDFLGLDFKSHRLVPYCCLDQSGTYILPVLKAILFSSTLSFLSAELELS